MTLITPKDLAAHPDPIRLGFSHGLACRLFADPRHHHGNDGLTCTPEGVIAYDAWMTFATDMGDATLVAELARADRLEFARAWDYLVAQEMGLVCP